MNRACEGEPGADGEWGGCGTGPEDCDCEKRDGLGGCACRGGCVRIGVGVLLLDLELSQGTGEVKTSGEAGFW